jgi:hypothetical protein
LLKIAASIHHVGASHGKDHAECRSTHEAYASISECQSYMSFSLKYTNKIWACTSTINTFRLRSYLDVSRRVDERREK